METGTTNGVELFIEYDKKSSAVRMPSHIHYVIPFFHLGKENYIRSSFRDRDPYVGKTCSIMSLFGTPISLGIWHYLVRKL